MDNNSFVIPIVSGLVVWSEDDPNVIQPVVESYENPLIKLYHQLWNELHTDVRNQEQFESWVRRVPNFGCGCASWLKDYVANNPYPVDKVQPEVLSGIRARYGWTLHNAVNAKLRGQGLDRAEFTWAEFEEKYPTPAA